MSVPPRAAQALAPRALILPFAYRQAGIKGEESFLEN